MSKISSLLVGTLNEVRVEKIKLEIRRNDVSQGSRIINYQLSHSTSLVELCGLVGPHDHKYDQNPHLEAVPKYHNPYR